MIERPTRIRVSARNWIVLTVKRGKEKTIIDDLVDAGHQVLFPLIIQRYRPSRHSKRRVTRTTPLFPGYLFVGMPRGMTWFPTRSFRHVHYMLKIDDQPYYITPFELHRLKYLAQHPVEQSIIRPNALVKVLGGALKDAQARVASVHKEKVTIQVPMFGSIHNVQTDLSNIELVG